MLKEIGAAIASERARLQLGTEALGIDPRVIEDIEAGQPGMTTTQLETVAAALQVDPNALRAGKLVPRPQPSVFLLHRGAQDFEADELPVLDAALDQARTRNTLAQLVSAELGLFPRSSLTPQPTVADSDNAPAHQGYRLARELRRIVGNDAQALGDMRDFAERTIGVALVVRRPVTPGSAAFAIKAGDAAAIVLAPSQTPGPHTRVWIAHELCHVLFDPAEHGGVAIAVDFVADRRAYLAEQRARAFAAELLLPEAGLRALLGPPAEVAGETAARNLVARARDAFGATWQVTANHLCNLRFIHMDLREWLESQRPLPPTQHWITPLPQEGAPSLAVVSLTKDAHDAGHLTDGEARAILGIDLLSPIPWDR